MVDTYVATTTGKLTAASAVMSSASDMVSDTNSGVNPTAVTDVVGQSNTSNRSTTNAAITGITGKQKSAISVPKAFFTQPIRQSIVEIQLDSAATDVKEKINGMTAKQIAALSAYSGIDIKTDADLQKALTVTAGQVKTIKDLSATDLVKIKEKSATIEADTVLDALVTSAANKFPKVDGLTNYLESVFQAVPNVTDADGNIITGIPGTSNFSQVSAISSAIKYFCSEHSLDLFDFGLNLNLYNALLKLCAALGLAGLVASLAACSKLFDFGGAKVLKDVLPDVVKAGDAKTTSTISSILGPGSIANADVKMDTLLKNMPTDTLYGVSNVSDSFDNFGLDKTATVKKTIPGTDLKAISIDTLKSYDHNPDISDYIVGEDAADIARTIQFS